MARSALATTGSNGRRIDDMIIHMKQLLVQFDDQTVALLERIAPGRSRKRSEFIRRAVARALQDELERRTRAAYERWPDEPTPVAEMPVTAPPESEAPKVEVAEAAKPESKEPQKEEVRAPFSKASDCQRKRAAESAHRTAKA